MSELKYKVGDRVRIKSIDWYNENKDEVGNIVFSSKVPQFSWNVNVRTMFTKDMVKFCGKVVTIESVWTVNYSIVEGTYRYYFTDEMIEGLVEEETKPKFKIGNKIKLKSTLLNDIFGVIGYEPEGYRITNISNGLTYFMSYSIEHYYKLVEEETKIEPKFKVGDKVILDPYPCVVTDVNWRDSLHGFVYTVRGADFGKMVGEEDLVLDESEKKLSDESWRYKNIFDSSQYPQSFECPEGYKFVDENGNVINAQKIVLEKLVVPKFKKGDKIKDKNNRVWYVAQVGNRHFDISRIPNGTGYFVPIEDQDYYELVPNRELPKTYEECSVLLGCEDKIPLKIIGEFTRLINARNAYWKLYGEEKGLGKPWEPDWESETELKYTIVVDANNVCEGQTIQINTILAFPTEEMRDAFYENFKELIEFCKELL